MGEIADYYLDHWYDDEDVSDPPPARLLRCRYCKQRRLHWLLTDNGWRLADAKGNVHACDAYKKGV